MPLMGKGGRPKTLAERAGAARKRMKKRQAAKKAGAKQKKRQRDRQSLRGN